MTLAHSYEFVLLFDIRNSYANGDQNTEILHRIDPETCYGIIPDISLRSRVNRYVEIKHGDEEGRHIYNQDGAILTDVNLQALCAVRSHAPTVETDKELGPRDYTEAVQLKDFMCQNFFDVRTFGAKMSTDINCGHICGPVQISNATSVERIAHGEVLSPPNDGNNGNRIDGQSDGKIICGRVPESASDNRNNTVSYALYRADGYVSAELAELSGFSEKDLALLFEALSSMFEHDQLTSPGEFSTCRLIVFRQSPTVGDAAAKSLYDRVTVSRSHSGELLPLEDERLASLPPARSFLDYAVEVDWRNLPERVDVLIMA